FVEELFQLVLELIRPLLAHVLHPWAVVAEGGVRERLLDQRILDAVQLQREEQKMRGRGRDTLLHVAEEFRALRVGGVAGVDETREGNQPAQEILDRLEAPDRDR